MSFNNLVLKKVEDLAEWDLFVKNSQDGTIFATSLYLNASKSKYDLWWVLSDKMPVAGAYFTVSEHAEDIIPDDLLVYTGLFFNMDKTSSKTKLFRRRFLITEFVANELPKIYNKIDFSLSPEIVDPRAFQFYGYGKKINKYKCEPKFTSYVDLESSLKDKTNDVYQSNFFINIDPVKRRDIKMAIREEYHVSFSKSIKIFSNFYKENLFGQGIKISNNYLKRMENLISELEKAKQAVHITISKNDNTPVYSIVYAWDHKKAYYLFGSGSVTEPTRWQGIVAQWEGINYIIRNTNLKLVDLEGINSPERGRFKMMLGGKIKPYYNINL